jgi:hypothetical protein
MIYEKVFFEVIKSSHYSGIILNFTAETQRTQRELFFSFSYERKENEKQSAYVSIYMGS